MDLTDPATFGAFYREHAAGVLAFFVRRTRSAEVGAELMAETFAAALKGAASFDGERGPAVAWLYGIARHKLTDFQRTGAVEREARLRLGMPLRSLDDEQLERVEALASLPVSAAALDDALDALPAEQRAAIVSRVVDEDDYDTIGAATGVSATAARQRVSRGLATMRARLGGVA